MASSSISSNVSNAAWWPTNKDTLCCAMIGVVIVLLTVYLCIVQSLRYRIRDQNLEIYRKYYKPGDVHLKWSQLHTIGVNLAQYELCFIGTLGLQLALFRTYAIPSISKILLSTKELTENTVRRYEDTDLILREIYERPSDAKRPGLAIERLNFLHGMYKISNDDMIYTMSLFVLEPIRWVKKYGWREHTKEEKEIILKKHNLLAEKMGIRDFPETLEAWERFREDHEAKFMVYVKSNELVAKGTVDLFINRFPAFARSSVKAVMLALLDDRLRVAMGYERQPQWLINAADTALRFHGWFVRWFMLPRLIPNRRTPEVEDTNGRYIPLFFEFDKMSYKAGYEIGCLGPEKFKSIKTVPKSC
jgi:hypothetical protein